jgi:hypothetical protein
MIALFQEHGMQTQEQWDAADQAFYQIYEWNLQFEEQQEQKKREEREQKI